jgi:hypothetical protein
MEMLATETRGQSRRSIGNTIMNRIATTLTALGIAAGLAGCTEPMSRSSNMVAGPGVGVSNPAANPNFPGATGLTIVPGDQSTIAGDAAASMTQRTTSGAG